MANLPCIISHMQFQNNYPLKKVTTLQIGGPAKQFVEVVTQEELIKAIKLAKNQNQPYLVIGGGSNLLISDEGIDCLVIRNKISNIATWKVGSDSFQVCAKSGTALQTLVDYSIENGLAGLEKLAGIPGTVGGAIYGNAGAYGQTISDHLIKVEVLHYSVTPAKTGIYTNKNGFQIPLKARLAFGGKSGMTKEECCFNYRDSIFKKTKDTILEVTFLLEKGDPETLQQEAQDTISKRLVKYPPGIKCPGSFFKNIIASTLPKEILEKIPQEKIVFGKLPAGSLLEEVGAKGQEMDGIKIAPYHANLFVNEKNGTAKDFYNLAKTYALKVKEKFGISLEPEVQLINLPSLT